jgi:ribosome-binding ATPase YchF (GTP1/OBG family)
VQGHARSQPAAAPAGARRRGREAHPRLPVPLAEAHALRAEPRRGEAGKLHEREREYREGPLAGRRTHAVTAVCGKIEAELAELPAKSSASTWPATAEESGLERLISATYSLLGLMSFLTAGEDECRAWTIPMHSTAVKAAGAIHSDFEKKFIRAEVVNWKSLVDLGGYAGAREKGQLRLEGKEYIVKDGDVLVIRIRWHLEASTKSF